MGPSALPPGPLRRRPMEMPPGSAVRSREGTWTPWPRQSSGTPPRPPPLAATPGPPGTGLSGTSSPASDSRSAGSSSGRSWTRSSGWARAPRRRTPGSTAAARPRASSTFGAAGPFKGFYNGIAGAAWADWLFMAGLAGIGMALLLGIGMRVAAVAGGLLLRDDVDRRPAPGEQPLHGRPPHLRSDAGGLALVNAGDTLGLGRAWARLPLVGRLPGCGDRRAPPSAGVTTGDARRPVHARRVGDVRRPGRPSLVGSVRRPGGRSPSVTGPTVGPAVRSGPPHIGRVAIRQDRPVTGHITRERQEIPE